MARKVNKAKAAKIAKERIHTLFREAEQAFPKHPERSDRYVEMARKIAMKSRVRVPRELRRKFCGHCHCYWMPGKTVRVRTRGGHLVLACLACKHLTRIPYK